MGNILVALYNDTPKHRGDNFLKLVNSGYYDGCIFQRVIKNFMIQGGDYSCRKKSSILNIIISADSSVLLAKEMMKIRKASASTDFYITWGRNFSPRQMEYYVEKLKRDGKYYAIPSEQLQKGYIKHGGVPHLDNGYTVFGEVLEGMDVVDRFRMWLPIRRTTTDLSRMSSF
ncbi:peptidyl-prolyl cis-trans isomerase CYP18-1-like [Vulpes lagopus]|uniref:peptidyl-prolyl cis-trans isomerase CYP18-1-like n=1 Tax=Vulpes lagopus TaxID=494514 RepID=UPI001BC94CC3|nr:peptidyl-prolyl cis-trans isomerase CYP18-1-like [Vulpes lagopus]